MVHIPYHELPRKFRNHMVGKEQEHLKFSNEEVALGCQLEQTEFLKSIDKSLAAIAESLASITDSLYLLAEEPRKKNRKEREEESAKLERLARIVRRAECRIHRIIETYPFNEIQVPNEDMNNKIRESVYWQMRQTGNIPVRWLSDTRRQRQKKIAFQNDLLREMLKEDPKKITGYDRLREIDGIGHILASRAMNIEP